MEPPPCKSYNFWFLIAFVINVNLFLKEVVNWCEDCSCLSTLPSKANVMQWANWDMIWDWTDLIVQSLPSNPFVTCNGWRCYLTVNCSNVFPVYANRVTLFKKSMFAMFTLCQNRNLSKKSEIFATFSQFNLKRSSWVISLWVPSQPLWADY